MTEAAVLNHELVALRAGDQIGPYKILSLLGQGGMGSVFLARHGRLDRDVAIKVLRPDSDPSPTHIERFVREAKAAAAIRHPHVVDVYDVGAHRGALYMVMERLHGDPLSDVLEGRKKLSVEETLDVILPILDALDLVHDEGIVHRDVKPDNIFIVRGRRRTFPKLLDFGVSKVRAAADGPKLTGASALMGTPAYMAPEQIIEAREVDRRADLYSVCAIVFECVTGRRPFRAHTVFELLRQVVEEPAPRASSIEASIPAGLDEILAKGLAKRPDDRFASADELSRALVRFASAEARVLWGRDNPSVTTARAGSGARAATVAPRKPVPLGRSSATIDVDTVQAIDALFAKELDVAAKEADGLRAESPARQAIAGTSKQAPASRPTARALAIASGIAFVSITLVAAVGLRDRSATSPSQSPPLRSPPSTATPTIAVTAAAVDSGATLARAANAASPDAAALAALVDSSHERGRPRDPITPVTLRAAPRATVATPSRHTADAGHRPLRPHESVYAID